MEKPVEARTYFWTWAALIVLTATTFGLSHIELGPASTGIGLIIAVGKALLIALVFMNLLRSDFTHRFILVGAVMTMMLLVLVVTMDVTTKIQTEETTTALVVARPTPWVPPLVRMP